MIKSALVAAMTLAVAACNGPTTAEPSVTSTSPRGATVEYSGEGSGQADQKAQQACGKEGKRAVAGSVQPGPSGGTVKSYDCR
jgi:hypothetical protein